MATSMNRDAFKPRNTLERTPPGTPSMEEKEMSQSESTKSNKDDMHASDKPETATDNNNADVKDVLNKTQDVDTSSDVEPEEDSDVAGKEEGDVAGKEGSTVKRLGSNMYKPFGSRSSSGTRQPSQSTCPGGPGRKKGSKKKCGARVEDEGVCCDGCNFWFHLECQKVLPATYKALQQVKGLFWICWECRENLPDLAKRVGTMGEEKDETQVKADENAKGNEDDQAILTEIRKQKEEILAAMKQHESEIISSIKEALPKQLKDFPAKTYAEAAKKTEEHVSKLQTAMDSSVALSEAVNVIKQRSEEQSDKLKGMEESMVKQMTQQQQALESNTNNIQKVVSYKEKENRAQNLIFHNIEESKSTNVEERKEHDEKEFKEMMKKLMGENRDFKTEKIIRLGKKDETMKKNRLMLVRLSSKEDAEEIFKNRRRMREVNIENKYISMDRTPEERKKYHELKKELEEKGPGTHRIFRGKIIRNQ